MANIKQYGGANLASNWASIILESDTEATTLPTSKIDATKTPLQGHNIFSVGSEAFCPSSGHIFVLAESGWIKL